MTEGHLSYLKHSQSVDYTRDKMTWKITKRNYKRKKTSIYIREDTHQKIMDIADEYELSFSESMNRILENGLRMV